METKRLSAPSACGEAAQSQSAINLNERISIENNTLEAEARRCATSRVNGTAPASGYPRARALPKVRNSFEDAHGFRKCASWKIPTIPSKMRTLFQGAHEK
jgi:hypothetical protein